VWKTNVIIGFRKTGLARETVREKRVLSPLRIIIIILFPFQYSVTGQCGGKKIPSVGRAFYDSHGVFRSLYPFLTTFPNPTLNPCIMRTLKINTIKKKHNVRCKIKFPNTSEYTTLLCAFPWDYFLTPLHHHVIWQQRRHLYEPPFDRQLFQRVTAPQAVFWNFELWSNACQNDDLTSTKYIVFILVPIQPYTFGLHVNILFNLFIAYVLYVYGFKLLI